MNVPVFLQIEPKFNRDGELIGGQLHGATRGYPQKPKGGTALVELDVELPDSVFSAIAHARIVVPERDVKISVDVVTPED